MKFVAGVIVGICITIGIEYAYLFYIAHAIRYG